MEHENGLSLFRNLIFKPFRDFKLKYTNKKKIDNRKQSVVLVGDPTDKQKEFLKELIMGGQDDIKKLPQNVESEKKSEKVLKLDTKKNLEEENYLKKRLEDYNGGKTFFLSFNELLYIYSKKVEIDFSKEELVYLIQSSFYCDFPYWYWSYLYREKFGNILPVYSGVFKTESAIIRVNTVKALSRFIDTDEKIVSLSETEYDENVLAEMIIVLGKNKNEELISRVVTNIISRRLLPQINFKDLPKIKISLGKNEKQFLYENIKNGCDLDKISALNILSLSAHEDDLPLLEEVLKEEKYIDVVLSVLNCIVCVGKINNLDTIIDNIKDSKREKEFLLSLDVYGISSDKSLLETLYKWLINDRFAGNRFSSFMSDWQYNRKIEEVIVKLCDKEFYEFIVKDLEPKVERGDGYLYTWSYFNLLKALSKNKKISKLLKGEKRLVKDEQWQEVVDEINLNEAVEEGKDKIIGLVNSDNYQLSMFALRKLWEMVPPDEVLKYEYKIRELRESLEGRLIAITKIGCSKNLNEKAKKGLDYFLGENTSFYRNYANRDYKYKLDNIDNKSDIEFYKLWEDISWFDSIEREFIKHALVVVTDKSEEYLISQIGKPHEEIYDNINLRCKNLKDISEKLKAVRGQNLNPMVVLKAIEASNRINIEPKEDLRKLVLGIYNEYRIKHQKDSKKIEYEFVYGASFRTLVQFGDLNDLKMVDEYVQKGVVFKKIYFYYSHFYSCKLMSDLYSEYLLTKKNEEKKDIISVLENIDNNWSKKILQIDN